MAIPCASGRPAGPPGLPVAVAARSILLAGALVLPVLGGACAMNGEAEKQVRRDLAALRQDLHAVNLTLDANRARADQQIREIAQRADEAGRGRAAFLAQLQELVTEVRLAQGKLEENARGMAEVHRRLEENARGMAEANRRMDRLGERLDEAMNRVASVSTQVVSLEGQILAQQERVDQLAGQGAPPAGAAARPEAPRAASETADQMYRTALTDFTKQSYEPAVRGFQAFTQNFPRDGRAPDAQYWLAEALRAQGQYAQAAQAFESFVQKYPDSPRIATAQVRRGESLLLSGDKAGCAILQEVRARYARARAAVQAKDLLAQHCP